jgi:acylphosphatase
LAAVSYKVVISGQVQGVSFRASMREAALRLGITGWVRNREDGSVEAVVQGEEAPVERLLEWAKVGPPGARVISFERQPLESSQEQNGFRIVVPDWWEEEGEE